jgi:hypothetical protein
MSRSYKSCPPSLPEVCRRTALPYYFNWLLLGTAGKFPLRLKITLHLGQVCMFPFLSLKKLIYFRVP